MDRTHAALSFQFFSKTIKNVRENPRAWVGLSDYAGAADWVLDLEFRRSETSGPIFDARPDDRPGSALDLEADLAQVEFDRPWTQARACEWWGLHQPRGTVWLRDYVTT